MLSGRGRIEARKPEEQRLVEERLKCHILAKVHDASVADDYYYYCPTQTRSSVDYVEGTLMQ